MARDAAAEARDWIARYPIERLLTGRQIEVARLLAAGVAVDAIAAGLGVSPKTARGHVRLLRRRMAALERRADGDG